MYNYNYPCTSYPPYMTPWKRQEDRIYNRPGMYGNPYFYNNPMLNPDYINMYPTYPYNHSPLYQPWALRYPGNNGFVELRDYGPNPFVVNIEEAAKQNQAYRRALWTGDHLQVTLMSLNPGEDIGLEMHPDVDQFIRIEEGRGLVQMGDSQDNLPFEEEVEDDYIFIIPAGKWHNLTNTGTRPLKLYSIYAPAQHPHGTVQESKGDSQEGQMH